MMLPRFPVHLVAALLVAGCDLFPTRPGIEVPSTVSLLPDPRTSSGSLPPKVDSILYEVRDVVAKGRTPTVRKVRWQQLGDTLVALLGGSIVEIKATGIRRQPDGTSAIWWKGSHRDTLPMRTASFQLSIPVIVGDTAAPEILSRSKMVFDARDTTPSLFWVVRDADTFAAQVENESWTRKGDTLSWVGKWQGHQTISITASFRDATGNLILDTMRALRLPLVAAPVFTVPPGSHSDIVRLGMTSSTLGAILEASLDSGRSWRVVESTLEIGRQIRVWARARKPGMSTSDTIRGEFLPRAAAPLFSVPTGTRSWDVLDVAVRSATPGARMEVSMDSGRTWNASSDTIRVDRSIEVHARAVKLGLPTSEVTRATYQVTFDPPAFSVPSGTASSDLLVVRIVSKLAGGLVECSTDSGRTWAKYGDSLVLGRSLRILARATKGGIVRGGIASATYNIAAAAPTFSVASGTVASDILGVCVSSTTPGSTVEVTMDSGRTWYSIRDTIRLGRSIELRARATKAGLAASGVAAATYIIVAATPTFSVASGTVSSDIIGVRMSSATPGSTIEVTMDSGRTWNAVRDSIRLGRSIEIRARATKAGLSTSGVASATYSIAAAAPTFSVASGTVASDILGVRVSSETPGSTVEVTMDSGRSWTSVRDTIRLGRSVELRARATKAGLSTSGISSAMYVVRAAQPTPSIPSGSRHLDKIRLDLLPNVEGGVVQVSLDSGRTWIDGRAPLDLGRTIRFLVRTWKAGLEPSSPVELRYEIALEPPSMRLPNGSSAYDRVPVILGSTASNASFQISLGNGDWYDVRDSFMVEFPAILYARAVKDGMDPSPPISKKFDVHAETPRASVPAGEYGYYPLVQLESSTPGSAIHFTLDGTEPTTASPRYISPVLVDSSYTLKAATFKPGLAQSQVFEARYDLRLDAMILSSIPSGTFVWGSAKTRFRSSIPEMRLNCSRTAPPTAYDPECSDSFTIKEGEVVYVGVWSRMYPLLEPVHGVFQYPSSWNRSVAFATMKDPRDGKEYRTVALGTQEWLAQNLDYAGHQGELGACPASSLDSCAKYGRLYSWSEAVGNADTAHLAHDVCPEGWRVPDTTDWNIVENWVGRADSAGHFLKSTSWWSRGAGDDRFGFRALPAGGIYSGIPFNRGEYAEFWTSVGHNAQQAKSRFLNSFNSTLTESVGYVDDKLSIRCMRSKDTGRAW